MQTKHSSQLASLIGKMLGQKNEALKNTSDHFKHREAHEDFFAIPDACGDFSAQLSTTSIFL